MLRRVEGESMSPYLMHGQKVLAVKWLFRSNFKLRIGDVIIFNNDGVEKLKRVKSISRQGLFLTGDNRNNSTDSRHFGLIKPEMVVAKVVWPRR
jgi:nickel-type superoxide dismutase maturation protease